LEQYANKRCFETHVRKLTALRHFQSDEHKHSRFFENALHRKIKNKSIEIRFANKQAERVKSRIS